MLSQGLPVSRLVPISLTFTGPPTQAPAINTCLVIGPSNVIDPLERMREYADLAEVGTDFDPITPEYQAAASWFAQRPQPTNFFIGRWVKTPSQGKLVGGTLPVTHQLISFWTGITNGGFVISIDGAAPPVQVGNLNFSGVLNINGVAAIIQAGFATAALNCTIVWNASFQRFEITSASMGSASSVSFLAAPSGGVTDISNFLVMTNTPGNGCYAAPGQAAESALSAVILFDNEFSTVWYALGSVLTASDADIEAVAAYIEGANPHYFGVTTAEAGALVPTDQTNIAYQLYALGFRQTAVQYSSSNPYAIISYLARILTTIWNGINTTITLMYKDEPGVVPELINTVQANSLQAINCNVYATYASPSQLVQYGTSANGDFTDLIIGADAWALQVQTNIFNLFKTTPTKIPQTDAGANLEIGVADAACSQFVNNGFLAAGQWNSGGFGTLQEGDFLPKGYYIFMPPLATQDQATRQKRIAPLMMIAGKTAGAFHTAPVSIVVEP